MDSGRKNDRVDNGARFLSFTGAFMLGIGIGRLVGHLREKRHPGEPRLLGAAANISKLNAAWRAVESLDIEGKLFTDELAVALSGAKTYAKALAQTEAIDLAATAGHPGHRLYKISRVAAETYWLDRQIAAALTTPATAINSNRGWLSARIMLSARGRPPMPRQLVVLGAGMDTRPWRLHFPPALHWFEVDSAEVLAAKHQALTRAGAQTEGRSGASSSSGGGGGNGHPAAHPLRCSQRTAVAADLRGGDWAAALKECGFDPGAPTVWVVEHVLEFLDAPTAMRLLVDVATVSAPGSTLVGHSVTTELLRKLEQEAYEVEEEKFYPENIMKAWKSGLGLESLEAELEAAGWVAQVVGTRAEIAAQITAGQPEGKCEFETEERQGADRHAVFFVAKMK